jgi:hypothetical protein
MVKLSWSEACFVNGEWYIPIYHHLPQREHEVQSWVAFVQGGFVRLDAETGA